MTEPTFERQTIVTPEEMRDAVNAALGLSIREAGWSDAAGNAYGAASLVPEVAILAADLPGLAVVELSGDAPLTLTARHVHVVSGLDGALVLDGLGLGPLL